ncbi:hypothetical protein HPB50_024043 [Hyalomma asiaticum]|uniref:Uncharacterized protein n=1 Tax=Hyalomma asiaticum TaxID=266040 RepID=A0ACB7T141_HYAAI|nr:hypothetical protein HPB50_024043 [Hyalomma asiaticum]
MESVIQTALATIAALLLVIVDVHGEVTQQEDSSVVDAFKVFRAMPSVVAIYDIDHDGDLDCATAVQTELTEEPEEATYVLQLKSLGGRPPFNLTYHAKRGPAPNTPYFTLGDDYYIVQQNHIDYTDYQNCVVMGYPYKDVQECILWVTEALKDDVPQGCVDYFDDNCDSKKESYVKDACTSS